MASRPSPGGFRATERLTMAPVGFPLRGINRLLYVHAIHTRARVCTYVREGLLPTLYP
jgi:hypothetical protein